MIRSEKSPLFVQDGVPWMNRKKCMVQRLNAHGSPRCSKHGAYGTWHIGKREYQDGAKHRIH